MTEKPTGVFVRLPLSEEDLATFNGKCRIEYDVKQDIAHLGGVEGGILAIGTPITGGELEVAGWCHPQQLSDLYIDNGSPEGERFVVMSRVQIGSRDIPLVRQSEAQAQIAARDAEITRLREALQEIRNVCGSDISEKALLGGFFAPTTLAEQVYCFVGDALKGGAA